MGAGKRKLFLNLAKGVALLVIKGDFTESSSEFYSIS